MKRCRLPGSLGHVNVQFKKTYDTARLIASSQMVSKTMRTSTIDFQVDDDGDASVFGVV